METIEALNMVNINELHAVGALVEHSILGTLTLSISKDSMSKGLEMEQDLLEFDELVIPTSYESHLVNVLDYDFYSLSDRFELVLVVSYRMSENNSFEGSWGANIAMNDENMQIGKVDIKSLMGVVYRVNVLSTEIEWDEESFS
ncbi:hypothetical protein [Rummeliibacillus sp. POC4]|uniref:hypothetical protein n=1 Tax=Rummeliibacillus sp. POC4 TaxID=2305899 RepID=UPI000E660A82|nr:hypothetical protein [Rummeliibacillus sp. POC4]RIJ63787.1 hypothetical protein D1606_13305 [Rummeliibacillus sp. POC4]